VPEINIHHGIEHAWCFCLWRCTPGAPWAVWLLRSALPSTVCTQSQKGWAAVQSLRCWRGTFR
jgi:hypothetical protein